MTGGTQYDAASLSNWFRQMYKISNEVAVFDRVEPISDSNRHTARGTAVFYWVHVQNSSPAWERELRQDMARRGDEFTLPVGYNNLVDVSESPIDGKMKVYIHYRLCAPGLPEDI